MITGVHTMFYTSEPEALRAFFRDTLGFPATDVGEGWLIFDLPPADLGCHPVETDAGTVESGRPHVSFWCDDLEATVADLEGRGVAFSGEIEDQGWGRVIRMRVPGDFEIDLYQPRYSK